MQKRNIKDYARSLKVLEFHYGKAAVTPRQYARHVEANIKPMLLLQLDLITDLLGTPSLEDMKTACEPARQHMMRNPHKPPTLTALYTLSNQATHEAVDLLCRMLVMDPVSFFFLFCFEDIVYLSKHFSYNL